LRGRLLFLCILVHCWARPSTAPGSPARGCELLLLVRLCILVGKPGTSSLPGSRRTPVPGLGHSLVLGFSLRCFFIRGSSCGYRNLLVLVGKGVREGGRWLFREFRDFFSGIFLFLLSVREQEVRGSRRLFFSDRWNRKADTETARRLSARFCFPFFPPGASWGRTVVLGKVSVSCPIFSPPWRLVIQRPPAVSRPAQLTLPLTVLSSGVRRGV